MARESVSGTDCSISLHVFVVDRAQRARRRRTTNHTTTPDIKAPLTTPPTTPPSIPPRFELVCEVDVEDEPDPDAVDEKLNVPVTSGLSEQHKEVCG